MSRFPVSVAPLCHDRPKNDLQHLPGPRAGCRTRCQGARKGRGAKFGRQVRSGQLFPASPVLQRRYCTTLNYFRM